MKRYIKTKSEVTMVSADVKRRHVIVKVYAAGTPYYSVSAGYVISSRDLEEILTCDTDNDVLRYLRYEGIFCCRPKVFRQSRPLYFYANGVPTPGWYEL